jgi:hypothetical protein
MTTKNPFPGMNPFFEQRWPGAHSSLITYIGDALQERLPPDLIAAPEEGVVTVGAGGSSTTYRPDVKIQEPWTVKEASVAEPPTKPIPLPTKASEPILVFVEEEVERWVEIRDTKGRLITVLELLSPSNKLESAERDHYRRKRGSFLGGGVNLVEVDLVRQGAWVFPEAIRNVLQHACACYGVCVTRPSRRGEHEVYPIRLRERLPAIRVPLRPSDADVMLDLQPLIDQCHERRRYHLLNYQLELNPPLPAEDVQWVSQLLTEHGLR